MTDYDKIHDKPYHFTLKRRFPDDSIVPEAIIPEDKCLYFSPKEMLEFRQFYKRYGREVPFERFESFSPDSYDDNRDSLLDFLYSSTSNIMKMIEKVYYPEPVTNRGFWLTALEQELPYNLDDYVIIPPKEFIDDALDDNFIDWIGLMNRMDLDFALWAANEELDLLDDYNPN